MKAIYGLLPNGIGGCNIHTEQAAVIKNKLASIQVSADGTGNDICSMKLSVFLIQFSHPNFGGDRRVQEEMARRSSLPARSGRTKTGMGRYSGKYAMNESLVCGIYDRQHKWVLWMPRDKKRYVWCCLNRVENGEIACGSPAVDELVLYHEIVNSMNRLIDGKELSAALLAAAELVG